MTMCKRAACMWKLSISLLVFPAWIWAAELTVGITVPDAVLPQILEYFTTRGQPTPDVATLTSRLRMLLNAQIIDIVREQQQNVIQGQFQAIRERYNQSTASEQATIRQRLTDIQTER